MAAVLLSLSTWINCHFNNKTAPNSNRHSRDRETHQNSPDRRFSPSESDSISRAAHGPGRSSDIVVVLEEVVALDDAEVLDDEVTEDLIDDVVVEDDVLLGEPGVFLVLLPAVVRTLGVLAFDEPVEPGDFELPCVFFSASSSALSFSFSAWNFWLSALTASSSPLLLSTFFLLNNVIQYESEAKSKLKACQVKQN